MFRRAFLVLVVSFLVGCHVTPLPVSPGMRCKFTPGCEDLNE